MNWIKENYKVGETIEAPHPRLNENQKAIITTLTVDPLNFPKAATSGVMVRFNDGVYMEIDSGYLRESGGGIV